MIVIQNGQTGNKKLDKAIEKSQAKILKFGPITVNDYLLPEEKTNKYHVAEKEDRTDINGTVFDSKTEMDRWAVLQILQKTGKINQLERQVKFVLQEKFFHHGQMFQPITYIADFMYLNISFREDIKTYWVVEDSKGVKTAEYKVKKKLFLKKYLHYYFFEV